MFNGPNTPVVQKNIPWRFADHVVVNGNDVDVRCTQYLEYRLYFAFEHNEIAIDHRKLFASGKSGPGIDAHLRTDLVAAHGGFTSEHDLVDTVLQCTGTSENLFQRLGIE